MSQEALWIPERAEYARPSMADVRAVPWNGLVAVGSFSGCGGSSLGLRLAGWRVPYAIEFIPAAADTYAANAPAAFVDRRDIRRVQAHEILARIGLKVGELDLFEGSPPCASFSAAGNRDKNWGEEKKYSDSKQRTDDLFWEWVRLLGGLMPRAFIAENVPGLTMGRALEEYAQKITRDLGALGYRVASKVMNSANYGVPQERRRLIFLGYRLDQGVYPRFPEKMAEEPFTTRQALADVDPADPDHAPFLEDSSMEKYAVGRTWHALVERGARREAHGDRDAVPPLENFCARCGELLEAHEVLRRDNRARVLNARCADGEDAVVTKDYFMLQVPEMDRPCPTLTATGSSAGAASVTHPMECRKLTPAEAKAVCGFPADFILTGSRQQRYERMGRAVTPPLYAAVGGAIAEALDAA